MIIKNILHTIGTIGYLSSLIANSNAAELHLDLQGNGQLVQIPTSYSYHTRADSDKLHFIYESCYKSFNLHDTMNDIVVLGPLSPCIGAIVTDGNKMIAFHKHFMNSLESMGKIIEENLETINKEQLYARLYTMEDKGDWAKNNRQLFHNGNTHREEVLKIKNYLESIGLLRAQIKAQIVPANNSSDFFGQYSLLGRCISVSSKNLMTLTPETTEIKISLIDPFKEDIYNFQGTEINIGGRLVKYENLPSLYCSLTGKTDGYKLQISQCVQRMNKELNELFQKNMGITKDEFYKSITRIENIPYDKINFFHLT